MTDDRLGEVKTLRQIDTLFQLGQWLFGCMDIYMLAAHPHDRCRKSHALPFLMLTYRTERPFSSPLGTVVKRLNIIPQVVTIELSEFPLVWSCRIHVPSSDIQTIHVLR